jgi:SNF2 family DNA or RNA helicase
LKNLQPTDIAPTRLRIEMDSLRSCAKPWKPWKYQELGIKLMLTNAYCGLLLDPGMGKTSTTLAASKVRLAKKQVKRVLIVAPLRSVYEVWPQEIAGWEDFKDMRVAILHGDKKDKVLRDLTPQHQVILVNPEGFVWLTSQKGRLEALGADMLVIDESSKWKNSQSVRFKALRKVLHTFRYRYILTGSPRPRNYEDLFGQIYILDRGDALGDYLTQYRNRYFYPTGYQMREWALIPGKEEEINALVAPMVLRLDAEDYLKMPGKPERRHRVVMPDKAAREYEAIEGTMLSQLLDMPLTSSAGKRSKCCQLANGAMYVDQASDDEFVTKARKWVPVHSAKVDALTDLYGELQGEPLLVSIGYHHDVEQIRAALRKDVPCINSKTTRSQASDFVQAWNTGKLDMLMIHPASAGHGLNLQGSGCRHVAYFDLPDDYDLYDQTFRRVWRQGNKSSFVMRHLFITEGTVDLAKLRNLEDKGTGQRDFLEAMKKYAREKLGVDKLRR